MKIQYASDLHIEFTLNSYFLHDNKFVPRADILVLAGDIFPFSKSTEKIKYFDYLSESFKHVYWLPGNHEYYYSDLIRFHKYKANPVRSNIQIVNNNVVPLDGVNLIFSTLWGHISPQNELYVKAMFRIFLQLALIEKIFVQSILIRFIMNHWHFSPKSLKAGGMKRIL